MFKLDNSNRIIIDPDLLPIPEFKAVWEADKSKTKEKAIRELQFVYYIADFKSPYRKSYREEDIYDIVKKDFIGDSNWKTPDRVNKAIEKYKNLQETKILKFLYKAENALEQIENYFDTFDINNLDADKQADAINKLLNNLSAVDNVSSRISDAIKRAEAEVQDIKTNQRQLTSRELPKSQR